MDQSSRFRDVEIRAPRGTTLSAKSWLTEAPLRMLMNNLDPEVAENPKELVVYGGIGRAARDWACYDKIVETLKRLNADETLLVQSGKPVGVFKTHENAPRVLIANSNLVPHWASWEHFNELDAKGLAMYGQMTAGSWIYIGSQGIVQGTYETFVEAGRQHFGGDLKGRWVLTAGLGGMGGAQPLAATLAGACSLNIECQQSRIDFRLKTRYVDEQATDLDDALARIQRYTSEGRAISHRAVRQRRRRAARTRAPWRAPRHGHRPDERARPAQRLSAEGLDLGAIPRPCANRPGGHGESGEAVDGGARARDARIPAAGHRDFRLRQQHPPDGEGRGRRERVRFSGLRAGVHPAAVLPRRRAVPLGGAVGRSARHLQDRRESEGTDPRRRPPAPLARHGARTHQFPGLAGAHLLGRARPAREARPRVQRDGRERRIVRAGRDRPRSPGLRLGREPESRNRSDAGRLGCRVRLAAAQRAAQHRERRHLGFDPPRRRRRHGLLAAFGRRDRLRRHRRSRRAHRPRAAQRSGDGRHASRGRGLRHRDRVRTRQGPRPADDRRRGAGSSKSETESGASSHATLATLSRRDDERRQVFDHRRRRDHHRRRADRVDRSARRRARA